MDTKETATARPAIAYPVRSLAREIGFSLWGNPDTTKFLANWTRLLAAVVARHTWPQLHAYADKIMDWSVMIQRASDDMIVSTCQAVHDAIAEIDDDDGWPADRAGNALNAVCLCAIFGLGDNPDLTRWPAEASGQVWRFVVGSGSYNEVVAISRSAWQRHIFGQALALTNIRDCLGKTNGSHSHPTGPYANR